MRNTIQATPSLKKSKKAEDHGIRSHHFMGNRRGNSVRLYFLGSKITADGDCSHEIKRYLLLGRKAVTNLDNVLKSRDITLPTKVCMVKAMVFPVVMYRCSSWVLKKLNNEGLMLLKCGVWEDSWESLELQANQTSQSPKKTTLNIHWKDCCWSFSTNTWATS